MSGLHKLLLRQLKKNGLSEEQPPTKEEWVKFIELVSANYSEAEEDRYLMERAITISSNEMKEKIENEREMNVQLTQANKLISVGTLASEVAHELNNPLAGIKGYVDILSGSKNLEDGDRKRLDRIIILIDRMTATVQQLLKFSRKPQSDEKKPLDLEGIVAESLLLYKSRIKHSNVTVSTHFSQGPHMVLSDNFRFISIIQNLINNSLDEHNKEKTQLTDFKKEIRIELDAADPKENFYLLNVTDNAGGIPPEIIEKIFESFFTTKDPGKGTGLGLSLSRRIARQMGGDLTCVSFDIQTIFTLKIPKYNSEQSIVSSIEDVSELIELPAITSGKYRVLVVDDDKEILDLLEEIFSHTFEVTAASTPEQALVYLKKQRFDILLTDLNMPNLTGEHLILVARELQPKIGLVLMSGFSNDSSNQIAPIGHIEDLILLHKPFPEKEKILSTLLSALPKSKAI